MRMFAVLLLAPLLLGGCATVPQALGVNSPRHAAAPLAPTAEATEVLGVLDRVAHGEPAALGGDRTLVLTSHRPLSLQPEDVTFEVAGTHADFVSRMGGTSAVGAAEVDCGAGKVRMRSVALHAGGETQTISAQGSGADWTAPPPGSALAVLVMEACPAFGPAPERPVYAEAPPERMPTFASQTAPISVAEATPTVGPWPAPLGDAKAAPPAAGAHAVVQIGAFKSPKAAEAAVAQAKGALDAGHARRASGIERVVLRGIHLFRAYIGGFGRKAEAETLCRDLRAHGQECFVRLRA